MWYNITLLILRNQSNAKSIQWEESQYSSAFWRIQWAAPWPSEPSVLVLCTPFFQAISRYFRYCKIICNSYWRGNENLTLVAAVSMAAQFRKQNDANQMKCWLYVTPRVAGRHITDWWIHVFIAQIMLHHTRLLNSYTYIIYNQLYVIVR